MPMIFIKSSNDPIIAIAEQMEPKLRKAFLHAVKVLQDGIGYDDLVKALNSGDVNSAMSLLALDDRFIAALNGKGIPNGIQSFRSALQDAFIAGATTASTQLPIAISENLSFNLFNPETVKFLDSYTFPLIKDLSNKTREGIRSVITDAFENGGHPYDQARKIKQFIGLTDFQSRAVLNYRKALSSNNTLNQALNRSLRDGRFDPTIQRAMRNNNGLSTGQIDMMTNRYQERYIAYRAKTIARSESLRASNKGQRALWKQAYEQDLLPDNILRVWIASGDSDMCEQCLGLDGVEVGLDEEFEPGVLDPGDTHATCRCGQGLVFPKAA